MKVFVLSKEGQPLMPTSPCRARHLIEAGEATQVKRTPFTIKMKIETTTEVQDVTLGVDAGSKSIGLSASTEKEELFSAEVEIRDDVPSLITARREARRKRRNIHTRYRSPRFSNRRRPEGWLTPTMRTKILAHENIIKDVCTFLPVAKIIIETASFDIQKVKNPEIEGDQYQKGEQLGYENVKAYVKARDGFKCWHCGTSKNLEVHHIIPRSEGGQDRPDNLITLCETCHTTHHHKKPLDIPNPENNGFRNMSEMTTMRWFLLDDLKKTYPNVKETYGYITNHTRNNLKLEKSHATDAWCIAGNLNVERSDTMYSITCVRSHNRKIYKDNTKKGGKRQRHQAPHAVMGIRIFDKVLYGTEEMTVTARKTRGLYSLKPIEGKTLTNVPRKRFELLEHSKGEIWTRHVRTSLTVPCRIVLWILL